MTSYSLSLEEQEKLKEQKKLQVMQMYQRLFLLLLYKHRIFYSIIFAMLLSAGLLLRYFIFSNQTDNYSGEVTLFYSPSDKGQIPPLSLPQLLEIFSRRQIMTQLAEEMGLAPGEAGNVGSRIKIQLLRDQHNMFKIHGKGPTRNYVQTLLNTFADIGIRNYREYRLNQLNTYLNERQAFRQDMKDKRTIYQNQRDELCKKYGVLDPEEELIHLRATLNDYHTSHVEMNIDLKNIEIKYRLSEKSYKLVSQEVIYNAKTIQRYLEEIRHQKRLLDKISLTYVDKNPVCIEARNSYRNAVQEFEDFKKEHHITDFREDMLVGLDQLVLLHNRNAVELEMARANIQALEAKIQKSEVKKQLLQLITPEFKHLTSTIKGLTASVNSIAEDIITTKSAITHINGELLLNEKLYSVQGNRCFTPKAVIVVVICCLMILLNVMIVRTSFSMVYGKIKSFDELMIPGELLPMLGVLPREDLHHKDEATILISTLYYNVMTLLKNHRLLFACAMDGHNNATQKFYKQLIHMPRNSISLCLIQEGRLDFLKHKLQSCNNFFYSDQDLTELDWEHMITEENLQKHQEAVAGAETGTTAAEAAPPPPSYKLGDDHIKAYFPITNINALSPDEAIRLDQTIQDLVQLYNVVIIRRLRDFQTPCMLLKQLMQICDATVIFVGKFQTKRKMVRKIMTLRPEGHKIYSVLTNSSLIKRIARGDYFQ